MSTFFRQTAQARIAKHIDRFPLLKLDQVIDWQPIEQYLNRQRTRYLRDHRGRPAYPLLYMFKAVLLGQWHSLSDPELEHNLIASPIILFLIESHLFDLPNFDCNVSIFAKLYYTLQLQSLLLYSPKSFYSGLTKTSTALPRLSSKRTIL